MTAGIHKALSREDLKKRKARQKNLPAFYDRKAAFFSPILPLDSRKKWYLDNYPGYLQAMPPKLRRRMKIFRRLWFFKNIRLPLRLSFLRWVVIDYLEGKPRKFWGIYQFVGLPGEGKTLSMVAHMERARSDNPALMIATNFGYVREEARISHWLDIVKVSDAARKQKRPCIIAIDEIHITFDSSDWRKFPAELLALLSFNRKFRVQFLCSSQIYERIPKKIRDIGNYTVICKNIWGADRLFRNYYFDKDDYEATFSGQKKRAKFIREYVADDHLYLLYDTLKHVDKMTALANEKDKKQEAFDLLFGSKEAEEDEGPDAQHPA